MLPRKYRLTGFKRFIKIKKEGKSFFFTDFNLVIVNRGDDNPSRIGFSISKKVAGKAVDRNMTKRIFREAVSSILHCLSDGKDVIVILKKVANRAKLTDLSEKILSAFGSAGLLASRND